MQTQILKTHQYSVKEHDYKSLTGQALNFVSNNFPYLSALGGGLFVHNCVNTAAFTAAKAAFFTSLITHPIIDVGIVLLTAFATYDLSQIVQEKAYDLYHHYFPQHVDEANNGDTIDSTFSARFVIKDSLLDDSSNPLVGSDFQTHA